MEEVLWGKVQQNKRVKWWHCLCHNRRHKGM